jgi:hypothetical protein
MGLEYLRTDCSGENLGLRERNQQENGESYIMESFLYCCMLFVVTDTQKKFLSFINSQHVSAEISHHQVILQK